MKYCIKFHIAPLEDFFSCKLSSTIWHSREGNMTEGGAKPENQRKHWKKSAFLENCNNLTI